MYMLFQMIAVLHDCVCDLSVKKCHVVVGSQSENTETTYIRCTEGSGSSDLTTVTNKPTQKFIGVKM